MMHKLIGGLGGDKICRGTLENGVIKVASQSQLNTMCMQITRNSINNNIPRTNY